MALNWISNSPKALIDFILAPKFKVELSSISNVSTSFISSMLSLYEATDSITVIEFSLISELVILIYNIYSFCAFSEFYKIILMV